MVKDTKIPRTSRQDALERARHELDDAFASPHGQGDGWRAHLATALQKLGRVFDLHTRDSEAPDGSLQEILRLRPQLDRSIQRIRAEHVSIRSEITAFGADVDNLDSSGGLESELLRSRAEDLSERLRSHQIKGTDLLYEAYYRVDGGTG